MKATYTEKQLVSLIKKSVKKDFGKSFTELKKDILNTLDCYGSTNHFKGVGYAIFYTSNENYMQGKRNGGGKGFFASLNYVGFKKIISLN